jgi:hypothetical protein
MFADSPWWNDDISVMPWGCTGKAESFIFSNEIVNREELQQALDEVVNDEGK